MATISENETQALALWQLREPIAEAEKAHGKAAKHDVSISVSRIAAFIDEGTALAEKMVPGANVIAFGHVGDGNVHFNVSQPTAMDGAAFGARRAEVAEVVYDITVSLGGSISAEHGIGVLKREQLRKYRSASEMQLMRTLRQALDPDHILNPGKVL